MVLLPYGLWMDQELKREQKIYTIRKALWLQQKAFYKIEKGLKKFQNPKPGKKMS